MENFESVNNNTSAVKNGANFGASLVGDFASIEFRCPQCFKLYRVNTKDIYSSQPQFECQTCHANFVFDYPPKNVKAIYTRALSLPQVGKLSKLGNRVLSKKGSELKACPKCLTMNPRGVNECYKCGVVFSKIEMVQHEPKAGHLPSLMKMWQDLMHDYNNMTKHMAFVDRCEELHALPFALKKYKDLKEVQPQDSLAHQMLNSVLIKSLSRQASQVVDHRFLSFLKEVPYANLLRVFPLVLGALLILLGLLSNGSRNFAGGGVAFLVLILGLTYVLKGRLDWRDFWR